MIQILRVDEAQLGGGDPLLRSGLPITYKTALGIASAAGPISDMTLVALSSIASWRMRNSNKKISLIFGLHAWSYAINTFLYSAKTQGKGWGDFAEVESYLEISHKIQTAFTGLVSFGTCFLVRIIERSRAR